MHPVVCSWDCLKIKVAQSVDLELKGQSWLKMAVDTILVKLQQVTAWEISLIYYKRPESGT
ncbi:hypothetical protein DPMN_049652 [Dreissena polymorpha]|uniref:Uncharacterized protein n=1 Tax=Dreissena polymorpha TaxID=45954 RepID=A0A9D4CFA3_DREPO|nr:hypothetical protein DPMN_049652 [Dreissena polymorpha]